MTSEVYCWCIGRTNIDIDDDLCRQVRDTGSPVCQAVEELLDGDLAICDPISMEVLGGGRRERQFVG